MRVKEASIYPITFIIGCYIKTLNDYLTINYNQKKLTSCWNTIQQASYSAQCNIWTLRKHSGRTCTGY